MYFTCVSMQAMTSEFTEGNVVPGSYIQNELSFLKIFPELYYTNLHLVFTIQLSSYIPDVHTGKIAIDAWKHKLCTIMLCPKLFVRQ